MHNLIQLLPVHPRLAPAALKMEEISRWRGEGLFALAGQVAAEIAQRVVLDRLLMLPLSMQILEGLVARFTAKVRFFNLSEDGRGSLGSFVVRSVLWRSCSAGSQVVV